MVGDPLLVGVFIVDTEGVALAEVFEPGEGHRIQVLAVHTLLILFRRGDHLGDRGEVLVSVQEEHLHLGLGQQRAGFGVVHPLEEGSPMAGLAAQVGVHLQLISRAALSGEVGPDAVHVYHVLLKPGAVLLARADRFD